VRFSSLARQTIRTRYRISHPSYPCCDPWLSRSAARECSRRGSRRCQTGKRKHIRARELPLRGFNEDEQCADILQRLAAARGSINSLMGELLEDHIRNHMLRNAKSSEEAAEDVVEIVRMYLK
jgi:hypothetical protein